MKMEKHILLEQSYNQKENKEYIGKKFDDFEILQTLGKGSYGYVSKVKSKINQKIYAMKMIDFSLIKDEQEKELAQTEIYIIEQLDNPHIIKFYGYFIEGEKYYILMDFINNGDMKGYIAAYKNMNKQIPEKELWDLFFQCILGLVYIHHNNIIHRDIKPANLFMTDNKTIKIGDFGVSALRNNLKKNYQKLECTQGLPKETLLIGTPLYMSPEMYNHQEYGYKVDVYALGCTFYEMCFFSPPRIPIPTMNPKGEIITDLQDVTPKEKKNNIYSKELLDLIDWMIAKDEKKRPNSSQVLMMINKHYEIQNLSIGCVFRCLFTYQNIIEYFKKHNPNYNTNDIKSKSEKPISCIFLDAYINDKNKEYDTILNKLREAYILNNPYCAEKDQFEPEDLIAFLIKKLHIENNKEKSGYSRIYTKEDDLNVLLEPKMIEKYIYTFKHFFKSGISDKFYGVKETIKKCLTCQKMHYCPESFYYLKFDANEVNKYFLNSNNFILDVFKMEKENYVQNELYCHFCKKKCGLLVSKKIMQFPTNLIISLESKVIPFNNLNLKYPLSFEIENNPENKTIYNLKGVIKESIINGKKYFVCIYKDKNQWFLSDGIYDIQVLKFSSPLEYNKGNIVMLFYSSENK